jgi:hypothetical protein
LYLVPRQRKTKATACSLADFAPGRTIYEFLRWNLLRIPARQADSHWSSQILVPGQLDDERSSVCGLHIQRRFQIFGEIPRQGPQFQKHLSEAPLRLIQSAGELKPTPLHPSLRVPELGLKLGENAGHNLFNDGLIHSLVPSD